MYQILVQRQLSVILAGGLVFWVPKGRVEVYHILRVMEFFYEVHWRKC